MWWYRYERYVYVFSQNVVKWIIIYIAMAIFSENNGKITLRFPTYLTDFSYVIIYQLNQNSTTNPIIAVREYRIWQREYQVSYNDNLVVYNWLTHELTLIMLHIIHHWNRLMMTITFMYLIIFENENYGNVRFNGRTNVLV